MPELLADGAALDDSLRGAPPESEPARGKPSSRAAAAPARRPAPAERRRAAIRVLTTWREVGRDLVVVARHDHGHVRHLDLLEQFVELAATMDTRGVLEFLERLDALIDAIEAYANPELTLDALVLAWPRARPAA